MCNSVHNSFDLMHFHSSCFICHFLFVYQFTSEQKKRLSAKQWNSCVSASLFFSKCTFSVCIQQSHTTNILYIETKNYNKCQQDISLQFSLFSVFTYTRRTHVIRLCVLYSHRKRYNHEDGDKIARMRRRETKVGGEMEGISIAIDCMDEISISL